MPFSVKVSQSVSQSVNVYKNKMYFFSVSSGSVDNKIYKSLMIISILVKYEQLLY